MSRPIWTGFISFGLVSVPVEMEMAVHEKTVHFHIITKDGSCRLRQKLYCPQTGKEYDFSQTARGIEVGPDNYAIVEKAEIDRLKPEKGRALEIVQFVDVDALDPVYFDRVYFLKPGKDAHKPYKLLLEAMLKSGKRAIAHFVMRDRQYLSLIVPTEDALHLHTLHYADEVEKPDQTAVDALKRIKVSAPEMAMAGELIKAMTRPLEMDEFKDDFRLAVQKLVDAKVAGKPVREAPQEEEHHGGATINLMEALKKSLAAGAENGNGKHTGRHTHRRSA